MLLQIRPPSVCDLPGDSTACDPRPYAISAAGEYDRHPGAEHHSRAVCVCQEGELFGKDIASLKIRRQKNVRISRDLGSNAFCLGCLFAYGIVKSKRTVENGMGDLAAFCHLAKCSSIYCCGHFRCHDLHRGEDSDLW